MSQKIGVMGAGAIGCYVGGALASLVPNDGVAVVFVGRARAKAEIDASGLELQDLDGTTRRAPKVTFETDPAALRGCDVVLCCVKSAQTAEVARALPREAIVVSMQNGLRGAEVLRAAHPHALAGIVGFNVVSKGAGVYRRTTTGPLVIEADPRVEPLAASLRRAGFDVELADDIRARQWSKLIMNLNNAVSALTDRPTPELIFRPEYRRILAAIMAEALAVLRRAGTKTARVGPLPVALFPWMLRLPTPILRVVAGVQLKVDPEARSSMWEDLARGRTTEIDDLNGEIVRLADSCGAPAPLNRRLVEIVHRVEAARRGSPKLSADALWDALHREGRT